MTNFNASAIAQQETVMEKEYREVFLSSSNGCRFTVKVRFNGGLVESFGLVSVSKPRAQKEALARVAELMKLKNCERVAWKMIDEIGAIKPSWTLTTSTENISVSKVEVKRNSTWNRFVNYFFALEEEINY